MLYLEDGKPKSFIESIGSFARVCTRDVSKLVEKLTCLGEKYRISLLTDIDLASVDRLRAYDESARKVSWPATKAFGSFFVYRLYRRRRKPRRWHLRANLSRNPRRR